MTEGTRRGASSYAMLGQIPGSAGKRTAHPYLQPKQISWPAKAKEATWMKAFLREIQKRGSEAIPLFCDNQGAIRVRERGRGQSCHMRKKKSNSVFSLQYLPSN